MNHPGSPPYFNNVRDTLRSYGSKGAGDGRLAPKAHTHRTQWQAGDAWLGTGLRAGAPGEGNIARSKRSSHSATILTRLATGEMGAARGHWPSCSIEGAEADLADVLTVGRKAFTQYLIDGGLQPQQHRRGSRSRGRCRPAAQGAPSWTMASRLERRVVVGCRLDAPRYNYADVGIVIGDGRPWTGRCSKGGSDARTVASASPCAHQGWSPRQHPRQPTLASVTPRRRCRLRAARAWPWAPSTHQPLTPTRPTSKERRKGVSDASGTRTSGGLPCQLRRHHRRCTRDPRR